MESVSGVVDAALGAVNTCVGALPNFTGTAVPVEWIVAGAMGLAMFMKLWDTYNKLNGVDDKLTKYLKAHSSEVSEVSEKLTVATREGFGVKAAMLSGQIESGLLKFVVYMTNAKSILEIGCFTGYSALQMAEQLPRNGTVDTIDIDPKCTACAQKHWDMSEHGSKITLHLAPAIEVMEKKLKGRKFDIVFMDANKDGQIEYLNFLLEEDMLTERGVVLVDNTLWNGTVLHRYKFRKYAKEVDDFNTWVKNDPRLECVMLSVRDGVTLIRKKD